MLRPIKQAFQCTLGVSASIIAIFACLSSSSFAWSDVNNVSFDGSDEFEEIVVTGSNIRRKDFQSASPIQTVGAREIADTGAIQVQDMFKGLTANTGSQLLQDATTLQGTSQFSLRGLGVGSTLTLINGRRAGLAPVVDGSGQLFTDANQYPVNMIKRIEVLTDGASSTYGSEAVAGVVNIFTRDDFEGFEIGGELRETNNQSAQINGAFGVQGDKGGLALFVNYYTQNSSTRSDFDNIADGNRYEDGVAGSFDSGTGSPGRFNLAVADNNVAGGWARSGASIGDPDCVAAGGIFTSDNCRYHFLDQRRIFPEEYRLQIFSTANYDISEKLSAFAEFGFSRNDIRDGNGGMLTRQFLNDGGFLVPSDHPFNFFTSDGSDGINYAGPDAFAADPSLHAVPVIYRGRVLGADADGPNQKDIKTIFTNTRLVAGFDYELNDNWLLYGSYVWSNSDYSRTAPREWDIPEFAAQVAAGNWNPFGTRLAAPGLISPKDGVSVAANGDDVLSTFDLFRNDNALVRQTVSELSLSGDTGIELPGGSISMAIGAQYREILLEDVPDGRYQSGNNRLNERVLAVFGNQNVYAIFSEVAMPANDWLEIQGAVRYEDYGDQGGSTLDPKIALRANVTDNLLFRASYGTSFQAPSIRQLAGIVGVGTVTDPLDPSAGAFIITVITKGSEDLVPQSASNLNLGVIYNADWGLDFSIDWFHYNYQDLILPGTDPQFIFDQVALGNLPEDRAVRSADGQVATAAAEFVNGGSVKASGFDIVTSYTTDVGPGELKLDAKSTILTTVDSSEFGNIKGNRNFSNGFGSAPDFRVNVGATYTVRHHRVNATVRHIGSYTDDQTATAISSNTTLDLRYDIDLTNYVGGTGTRLSIGAVNVFNTLAPRLQSRPFFDTEAHDPRGRQLYLSIKQGF